MFSVRNITGQMLRYNSARMAHTLPNLDYGYEALEPIISRDIMELHHCKHHQTYVNNYNIVEEKLKCAVQKGEISEILSLQQSLKFNGGGHLNHSIFWKNLSPCASQASGDLCKAIKSSFGSFDKFKEDLSTAAVAVQGSGWGWLGYCRKTGCLKVATCANQDPLEATTGLVPLLAIDVWEHAYYLQYKNVRADYVKAIFEIVNWKDVTERFNKARGTC